MTKWSLASTISGRQYGEELTNEECALAKKHGLVVLYGASDDLIEIRGVVYDEIGMYNGGDFQLTAEGVIEFWGDNGEKLKDEAMKWFAKQALPKALITTKWSVGDYSWVISSDIPFEPFDIMEDSEKFCRGIVISVSDFTLGVK